MSNTSFNSGQKITTSRMDPFLHGENSLPEHLSSKPSDVSGGDVECESRFAASVAFELIKLDSQHGFRVEMARRLFPGAAD